MLHHLTSIPADISKSYRKERMLEVGYYKKEGTIIEPPRSGALASRVSSILEDLIISVLLTYTLNVTMNKASE